MIERFASLSPAGSPPWADRLSAMAVSCVIMFMTGVASDSAWPQDGPVDQGFVFKNGFESGENRPPDLVAPGNRVIPAATPFTTTIFATDPDVGDVLRFFVIDGPGGLEIEQATGRLSWTPAGNDVGVHPVTLRVTDSGGLRDQESFEIEVTTAPPASQAVNSPPVLTVPGDQSLVIDTLLAVTASATDPDPGATLTYSFVNAPTGMTIDAATGAIRWTPSATAIGLSDVAVQVEDEQGAAAFGSFVVEVRNVNRAPVARNEAYEARIGETLSIPAPGVLGNDTDPDGDALESVLVSPPAKGVLDLRDDGSFDYTPGLPEMPRDVELGEKCAAALPDTAFQTNATIAVGDVDNDGDVELVGSAHTDGVSFISEIWLLNGSDCSEQGFINLEASGGFEPTAHPALVDVDNDGDLEIIGVRSRFPADQGGAFDARHLIAVHHDGALVWTNASDGNPNDDGSSEDSPLIQQLNYDWFYDGVNLADLDGDGTIEIIMMVSGLDPSTLTRNGVVVFNAEDGSLAWEYLSDTLRVGIGDKAPTIVDLDLDGTLEIISHRSVIDHQGNLEFTLPGGTTTESQMWTAVANFDDDLYPEILARDVRKHYLFEHDGTIKWEVSRENSAGGQLSVADFDGDGDLEYAHITCPRFASPCGNFFVEVNELYDPAIHNTPVDAIAWSHEGDASLEIESFYFRTENLTAFDANEDGAMDLVFSNESPGVRSIFIIDGRDGSVLESLPYGSASGGSRQAFVAIADVDLDGAAEIIGSFTGGLPPSSTQIWEGVSGQPLPPAPAFRNQWIFAEAYTTPDGKRPVTDPVPHWLQAGRNGWNLVTADRQRPVELEFQCEAARADGNWFQGNGTIAAGDVDNDGDVELVGVNYLVGASFLAELWILNASDCSEQSVISLEQSGGVGWVSQVGLLDIDGDLDLEIITTRSRTPVDEGGAFDFRHLIAVHHDGALAWPGNGGSESSTFLAQVGNSAWNYSGPTFADLDADGSAEIVMVAVNSSGGFHGVVTFNAADGSIAWEYVSPDRSAGDSRSRMPVISDLDLDGTMEVIVQDFVLDHEGQLEFQLPVDQPVGGTKTLISAVANFDDDIEPEIIARDRGAHYLIEHDGTLKWRIEWPINNNPAQSPITVADFDGDGEVEYADIVCQSPESLTCSGYFIQVYDTDGSRLWNHQGIDRFRTINENGEGLTAFDANKDGAFDLIFRVSDLPVADVFIFNGRDGTVLDTAPVPRWSSSRLTFVTVADVDGDGDAEIISSGTGGSEPGTRIWGGSSAKPLPAAPPFRNQWVFAEAFVSPDGKSVVTNPVPHWLQPGRNGWNLITPEPDPLVGDVDSFTYQANDGALDSNVATVSLEIYPPGSPPQFISEPDTLTTVGFQYAYTPRVFDPDVGDTVVFALTKGPAGMSINATSGAVRWSPDALGNYEVSILAADSMGFATAQEYTLAVGEPTEVPDVVGLPEASAETAISNASLTVGRSTTSTHPSVPVGAVIAQTPIAGSVIEFGGAVDLRLSLGPAPEDTDDDGDGFSENEGDCDDGNSAVFPGANDPEGDGIDQDCDGVDGDQTLVEIRVLPAVATILVNEVVELTAIGVFEDNTTQNLTGVVSWSEGPGFAASSPGVYAVTASRDGVTGTADISVDARVDDDDIPPLAELNSPLNDSVIVGPVDVIGSANDVNFHRYELAYARAGSTDFKVFASNTSSVTAASLGEFDPTMLMNDLYSIRLSVLDRGGNESVSEIVVQVEGNFKAGAFSLAYTDLELDLSGIPLVLNRVYDSRDRRQGLFGHGWRLDFQSFRINVSDALASGWEVVRSGITFGLVENGVHKVSVTLPSGQVEEFDLVVTPRVSPIVPFPSGSLTARWQARPGTVGSLRSLGNNQLSILGAQPGDIQLVDDLSLTAFNPDRFEYRHPLGATVILSASGGIESIEDANGNRITLSDSGMQHSSGTEIAFEKDALGRITRITGPGGETHQYEYDGNGDLRRHTDETGAVTKFRYQFDHYLIDVIDPMNRPVTRHEFDDEGRLVAIVDALGNRSELDIDIDGRQSVVTDRTGGVTVTTYDERGNAISMTDPVGNTWTYSYDEEDRRTSETNPLGETTTYAYDHLDNIIETVDALGHRHRLDRDENGRVLRSTDPSGVTTDYAYDARGNQIRKTDGLGFSETRSYDEQGELVGIQDRAGRSWNMDRDSGGRVTEIRTPYGQVNSISYDASGDVTENRFLVPRQDGAETITFGYERNERGQVTAFSGPMMPAPVRKEYNAAGELSGSVDPEGNSIGLERDITSRITRRTDSSGPPMLFSYDAAGREVETVLANGATIDRTWDARSLNPTTTMSDYGTRTSSFDALGRVTDYQEPGFGIQSQEYDAGGRPTRLTLPDGIALEQTFDEAGRTLSSTDALGHTIRYAYDDRGMLTQLTAPDGREYEQSWTADERLASRRDELGLLWRFAYDTAGNVNRVTGPANAFASFESNLYGAISLVESAGGKVTRYAYDDLGNPVAITWPDGTRSRCAFDTIGRQTSCTDAVGQTTSYRYEGTSAMVEVDRPEGLTMREVDDLGRLAKVTNTRGVFNLQHDTIGRLKRYENPEGEWVNVDFDANGLVGDIQTHSGSGFGFEYDARGMRIASLLGSDRVDIIRDAGGRPAAIDFQNGASLQYVFDEVGRVLNVAYFDSASSPVLTRAYSYDAQGRVVSSIAEDGAEQDWSYDELGRLATVDRSSGGGPQNTIYAYDADGNVVSRAEDGIGRSYVVNENDFLLSAGSHNMTWDANGNLLSRTEGNQLEEFEWDSQHRLIAYRRSGVQPVDIEYEYAFDGLLELRRIGSVTETFTWDRNAVVPLLIEHRSSLDAAPTRYLYADLMPVAEVTPAGDWVHHVRDRQGSLLARIAEDGTLLERFDYNAWGVPLTGSASPVGYTGAIHDDESGLIFLRSRWYAPDIERFLSRDRAAINPMDHRTINRYSYSLNDPVNRLDLSGQTSFANVVTTIAIANIVGVIGYSAYRDGLSRVFWSLGGLTEIRSYFLDQIDAKFASAEIFRDSRTGLGLSVAFFPTVNFNAPGFSVGGGFEFLKFDAYSTAYIWFGSRIGPSGELAVSIQAPTLSFGSAISHTPTPEHYEGPFLTLSLSFGLYASNSASFTTKVGNKVGIPVGGGVSGSLFWSPVVTYQDSEGSEFRSHGVRGGPIAGKGWSFGIGFATYGLVRKKPTANGPGLF